MGHDVIRPFEEDVLHHGGYRYAKTEQRSSLYAYKHFYDVIMGNAPLNGKRVLDVGCGSGLLSILMARKGANVIAIDVNSDAVKIAKENAGKNRTDISGLVSDLFENVKDRFDLIVFNPPYLPLEENETKDITYNGGLSGREVIETFIRNVKDYLNPSGRLLLVISSLTGEKEVIGLLESAGLEASVIARQKVPWEELVVVEAQQK